MIIRNPFALAGLSLGTTCLLLALFVLIFKRTKLHRIWILFNLSVAIWGFGALLIGNAMTPVAALLAWRIAHVGGIFIPVCFFHTVSIFCGIEDKLKKVIIFAYAQGFLFLILDATNLFISKVRFVFDSLYYNEASGLFYPIFFFIWVALVIWGFYELIFYYLRSLSNKRNQVLYFFVGMLVGFSGGITNFFPMFKIDIYPFGNFTIPLYCFIVTYAIFRYRLMDIGVAITRAGIFIFVYFFILGIPFWLGYKYGLWRYSTWSMLIFATLGPFIYQYLRQRTERLIFKEQHRYQNALRELSKTMTLIRDLDILLKSIVSTVVDTVKVSFAGFYLNDDVYKSYRLRSYYPDLAKARFEELIPIDNYLPRFLLEQKRSFLSEEIGPKSELKLDSGIVVPCFMEDELLGFMVFGSKPNHQMYTPDDILVFETLSYSTSLAIENCRFWREIEDRQRKARLQEMDTYSYSLAHEIDNPMQVVLGHVGYLKKDVLKSVSDEVKRKDLEESFDFILEAAKRVSGMVKAIRDFGQKTTGEFKSLDIEDVVESFSKLYYPQFKDKTVMFEKAFNLKERVFVRGEKPELMQVLVILANNSIHAMTDLKEKKVILKLEAVNHDWVRISFIDNGYGIKKEMLSIIFTPFTTTKASTEGTGMGLYNAQKIIEHHKGRVWAESQGEGKGATFIIELPIARDVTEEEFKKEDTKSKRLI